MLSERERRTLDDLERRTAVEDPRFVAVMQGTRPARADRWARHGCEAVIVLGVATAALCFVLLLIGAGVVAVLLVAAACYLRRANCPASPGRGPVLGRFRAPRDS